MAARCLPPESRRTEAESGGASTPPDRSEQACSRPFWVAGKRTGRLRRYHSRQFRGATQVRCPGRRFGIGEGGPDGRITRWRGLADDILNIDRKSTRPNSSHANISYAVFCLKKKTERTTMGVAMQVPLRASYSPHVCEVPPLM